MIHVYFQFPFQIWQRNWFLCLQWPCPLLEQYTYPGFEGDQFKDHLHCEESSEKHVQDVHGIVEIFCLPMVLQTKTQNVSKERIKCWWELCKKTLSVSVYVGQPHLHGQTDGVEKDECEHQVLKVGGVDHIPHLVLVGILGDVATQWTGLQSIFHTLTLCPTHKHTREHKQRADHHRGSAF